MGEIEHDDEHRDYDGLPLHDRMCMLAMQADDEHVMGWAVEVRRLSQQLAGAVAALTELVAASEPFLRDIREAFPGDPRLRDRWMAAMNDARDGIGAR